MHRFITLIANTNNQDKFIAVRDKLTHHVTRWEQILNSDLSCAWVMRNGANGLGHRPLGVEGCLIGSDAHPEVHDIEQLLECSWGAYVAISVDSKRRSVKVLRDPTGRIPCWRLRLDGADILFSQYADVYWLQPNQAEIDWAYIGHHLNQEYMPASATGLSGITELLPGEALVYLDGASQLQMKWWPHRFAAVPQVDVEAATGGVREAAQSAVDFWAGLYERITLDLSGGLDSSIVLGLLKHAKRQPDVVARIDVFAGYRGDERRFARMAAEMHGASLMESLPTETNVTFGTPFSRVAMRPHPMLLSLTSGQLSPGFDSAHGSEAYFTGEGGDHLFLADLPASSASDYLRTGGNLSGLLDTSLEIAQVSRTTIWNVLSEVLLDRVCPIIKIEDAPNVDNPFLTAEGRAKLNYERFGHPWVLQAARSTSRPKFRQIAGIVELQRHYQRIGRAEGAEEVHPLYSQRILETCLAVPTHLFAIDNIRRGLQRRAFADLLPVDIRTRRSKGGSTTHWIELIGRSLRRARELLLEGKLVGRGLLDRRKLEEALMPLTIASAKHFSPLLSCLATELWIQQADSDRRSAEAKKEL